MGKCALVVASLALVACGSKSNGSSNGGQDGGVDAGPHVTDRGVMVDYDNGRPLAGVTVTEGEISTTTDAKGVWSLSVPANVPLDIVMAKDGYTRLHRPELILTGDHDRGEVSLVSNSTFQLGSGALPNFDGNLGVIYVGLQAIGGCASTAGATITVNAPQGTLTTYFANKFPRPSQTSTTGADDPAAAVYNVQPGATVDIAITHPTCKMAAFPHTEAEATYTGRIIVEGPGTQTYTVFFLQP